ncbi:hypothetical protein, partial [Microbacterium sp. Ag1]|uniref:hypothetical protein n=1 Tax=Microbacterium sp. Ag1 TaxID=1643443 RepID=UPI001E32D4AB
YRRLRRDRCQVGIGISNPDRDTAEMRAIASPRATARIERIRCVREPSRSAAGNVVWADDRAPEDAEQRLTAMTEVPSLVVRPDKFVGLTLADVGQIDQFLDEQLVV